MQITWQYIKYFLFRLNKIKCCNDFVVVRSNFLYYSDDIFSFIFAMNYFVFRKTRYIYVLICLQIQLHNVNLCFSSGKYNFFYTVDSSKLKNNVILLLKKNTKFNLL